MRLRRSPPKRIEPTDCFRPDLVVSLILITLFFAISEGVLLGLGEVGVQRRMGASA
jgi:hypothetical protein